MAKLTFLLSEKKQVAEATMSFRFELAGQRISFQPGQFIRVGLLNPPHPDPKGNARSFSIASAPSDPFLLIASRMTGSPFKTSLAEVPLGAPVSISGPAGSFILDPNSRAPVALFAGGIGITPFRSMIKHVRENDPARRLTLVYANRCPEQAAFLEELEAWAKDNPNFHLLATMTQPEKSKTSWNGPTGYVDISFVRQYLPELPSGGCYAAGPPRFVAAVTQTLREAAVDGDQLKAASDLGVPVVGVGLLYQQGYFRQVIDKDGAQQALYPYNDPGQLPITPLRQANGEWLRLEIALPGYSVWLRAWQVQVGRVKIYLLDSNDAANFPAHRGITSELYGGGPELRLKQELLLGIGGWRLLAALAIQPDVCHLNEGHACGWQKRCGEGNSRHRFGPSIHHAFESWTWAECTGGRPQFA